MLRMLSQTDPSASQTNSEERLNHEAQELEKRLSMLSHRSSTGRACHCHAVFRFKVGKKKGETAAKSLTNLPTLNVCLSLHNHPKAPVIILSLQGPHQSINDTLVFNKAVLTFKLSCRFDITPTGYCFYYVVNMEEKIG